jgi:hypothetical protein
MSRPLWTFYVIPVFLLAPVILSNIKNFKTLKSWNKRTCSSSIIFFNYNFFGLVPFYFWFGKALIFRLGLCSSSMGFHAFSLKSRFIQATAQSNQLAQPSRSGFVLFPHYFEVWFSTIGSYLEIYGLRPGSRWVKRWSASIPTTSGPTNWEAHQWHHWKPG